MDHVAEALRHPEAYPDHAIPIDGIRVVETHISWIFLTGQYAYKLKKPVDLGFLDFSTLERRHHCCLEELKLNRRLCPDLYLDVLPVTVSGDRYIVGGSGPAADYVIRMVQFDRALELDRLLAASALPEERISEIATILAGFHRSARSTALSTPYGSPEVLLVPMLENLDLTAEIIHTPEESIAIQEIRTWTLAEHRRLEPVLRSRKENGFVRECHGDLHTGNMVIWKNRVTIFDCIEFNPNLSVIDVISDAAFLFMDLQHAKREDLAWRFLNGYLTETGDYASLRLLRLYCTYRAMVRAKVTAIRLTQETDPDQREKVLEEHRSYLSLALGYVRPNPPQLVLMHGVSGTGKSFLASELTRIGGFAHLRSDIERKRLFGIPPLESSRPSGIDIYTREASERTYQALLDATEAALEGGWPVIVDATFLRKSQRHPFIELAARLGFQCCTLSLMAPVEILRKRVFDRLASGADPSEANLEVLEKQLNALQPPDKNEKALIIEVDTQGPVEIDKLLEKLTS
ncbi:MAG: AAA family ATPase [Chlorobiaceae bacterium]|nr:AAA family ATPase [Chlorobiaceae bacterium]